MAREIPDDTDDDTEEPEDHYARCPDCDFEEIGITARAARSRQKQGCPNCNRGVGVSTVDNFPGEVPNDE